MKNIFSLLFLVFFFVYKTEAQNLVPNSSFENFTECPDTSTLQFFTNLDSTWFQYNSADYFNECNGYNYLDIPVNRFGYQYAHSGNAYTGLISYMSGGFEREYIEVKLVSPLVLNETYYVQLHVSLADTVRYAIENIGVLFTDTLFNPYPSVGVWLTGIPQVENSSGNMLNDKINWMTLSGSFVANGGEQYMTIGNFKNDANTIKQFFGGTVPYTLGAYYFIDDVYVGTTPPLSIDENKKEKDFVKLYPNPNNGNMTLECNLGDNESGELLIYSLTGKVLKSYPFAEGMKTLQVDASELNSGMYLYEFRTDKKVSKKGKLSIIK
ncbi:MAG TPA: T9SS type A sorting domain-containing protein [Bacteroidia bacterium]|jgi:hypothetical protein